MKTKHYLAGILICLGLFVSGCSTNTMVRIPEGSFLMGNCVTGLVRGFSGQPEMEGAENELPVHEVMISAFYMEKYEVTKKLWDKVYRWAVTNGYDFDNPGQGKRSSHPVYQVSWYDCVKWCNARSEKEKLTPCYYADALRTVVYRTGRIDLSNSFVNWEANGYRLPTEAEWEKAARGGNVGFRFPWGNTISHSQANYSNYHGRDQGDVSPWRGDHPTFSMMPWSGDEPYTSPVGYFSPNGYGLYDMAGNITELCWDWYDETYYSHSPTNNPMGPENGEYRMARGGGCYHAAFFVRCSYRWRITRPNDTKTTRNGFRCVRKQVEQ